MAGESFRSLVQVMGRIEDALRGISGLSGRVGAERGRLDAGNVIRDQLQSALSSPAIVRGLQDAISQGLGGGATAQIRDALSQYRSSIRAATAASQAQSAAQQRYAQAYAAAQPYAANPLIPASTRAAITGGTITPAAAQIVGGTRFRNIAQRMQSSRQQAQQAGARVTGARRAAQTAAQQGRQAALSPRGVPQGGGTNALANVIAGQGLGGMGTLVGSLFGPQGAVAGFLFDASLKAVTGAFNSLNKTVGDARNIIDHLSVWSMGGMQAAIRLTIADIHNQIYVSRQLGSDMIRFSNAQKNNIESWRDVDVTMNRFTLQVATAWATFSAGAGKAVSALAQPIKGDPLGALLNLNAVTGGIYALINYLKGKDEKHPERKDGQLTQWEIAFRDLEKGWRANANFGKQNPGAIALQQRLQLPGQGLVIPGQVNPQFQPPPGRGAAPQAAPQPQAQAPKPPQGPQVAPLVPGAQQIVDAVNGIMNWFKGNNPAPAGPGGLGGGP